MIRQADSDPDPEPPAGPVDRDERLGEAIEAYLELAEAGPPPEPEAFAADYPDLGEDLVAALEGLALVRGLVGGPHGPGHRLEEGRRVAGYRIVRELGRGGMGIVYEAVHVGLDRPVALKVLGTQAAPDSSGRRRFLNEARTAAGLHHTHIVPVFDVGQVGGLCYYAMQRIEGSGLDRVLRLLRRDRTVAAGSTVGSASPRPTPARPGRAPSKPSPDAARAASGLGDLTQTWSGGDGPAWRKREPDDDPPSFLPPRGSAYYRWVADVGRQAAEALAHAHQRGVIHRDIKPSNLLVDARGMIWVADFGLARRLADPSQTQVDSLLGTPRYMSPEQARTGEIDGRADVYSLGATLYELITLRPPFDGQSAAELIDQIARLEPPRPRKFDPRLPLDLETILLKALAKRPEDRYATAGDLADDLARFLAHEPVKARRIGPVGRLVRFARRHPSLTAVSTTAAALVLTTTTVAYVRVVTERDKAVRAQADLKQEQVKTKEALHEAQAARLVGLEKHATAVLVSSAVNRRSDGLQLLADAARLGPDPAMRVKLRDQALKFLTIRDVQRRPSIATPRPHGLAFGDSGRRIATLTDDNELTIWAVDGGALVDSARLSSTPPRSRGPGGLGGFFGSFGGARVVAAGSQVAVVKPDGSGVRLFDVAMPGSPADELPMKGHMIASIVASADGQTLVAVDAPPGRAEPGETRITLWDRQHPDAPRATLILPPPPARVDASTPARPRPPLVAVSPNGGTIAAVRFNEPEVALWDGEGMPLEPIDVQTNATALALGPAGQLAVAGGGEIVIWDLAQRKPLPGLGRSQGAVQQLRFTPSDGSLLAAATWPNGIELWDLTSHALVAAFPTRDRVDDLAFAPDGRTLAASQSSSISLWSIVEPVAQVQLPESGELPISLAFGPGDLLAIASRDASRMPGRLRLWTRPGSCPPEIQGWDRARPNFVSFDARGRLVTLDRALRWYHPPDPTPVAEIEIPEKPREGPRPGRGRGEASPPGQASPPPGRSFDRGLTRSLDGRALAFVRGGDVLIWRAADPEGVTRLDLRDAAEGPGGPGRNVGPSLIALASDGPRLFLYVAVGERVSAYTLDDGVSSRRNWTLGVRRANAMAISPDGSTLAMVDRSGELTLIDLPRGVVRPRLTAPVDDPPSDLVSVAFSPDGSLLAVGTRDQVRLWSVPGTPRPIVRLPGHRGPLFALAFDEHGTRLAGADEKTVKVWDLARLRVELGHLGLGW